MFGLVEVDLFSWYRMWLIILTGFTFILLIRDQKPSIIWLLYIPFLFFSCIASTYHRTSLWGSPWMHEGLIVLVSYIGLFLAGKKYGLFKGLETSIDIVILLVFFSCVLQINYGNFLMFPPLKWMMPVFKYQAIEHPLYGVMGCGNHLGLFCALLFPYTLLKKKWPLLVLILFMAIGASSRGSLLAIVLTTLFINKRMTLYTVIVLVFITVPFYKNLKPRINKTFHEIHYPLEDSDLSGRAYIWKRTFPFLRQSILTGYGPATYGLYFPQHEKRGEDIGYGGLVVDRPHNMYLNIWMGTGLISLIILLSGIGSLLLKVKDKPLQLSCISFLIAGLFTDSVLCVTPYFIIFLGCLSYEKPFFIDQKRTST